jgi:hypothetical protein
MHDDLSRGVHMYRLKIVDISERFEYSEIRSQELTQAGGSVVVFSSDFSLDVEYQALGRSIADLSAYNMSGMLVYGSPWSVEEGRNINAIDISDWSPGIYIVKLVDETSNEEYLVKQFVK